MSDKVTVYIVSMGGTPDEIGQFITKFSARYGIAREKVVALGKKLPAKVGTFDIDKAKQIGIEIRRMGGEVSLKRVVVPEPPPVPVTVSSAEPESDSWVVHGHSESQEDLRAMTAAPTSPSPDQAPPPHDWPPVSTEDVPPVFTPPPDRKVGGRYEPKQVYTTEQAFGLDEEHFKKVKSLYTEKAAKKSVAGSPAFKLFILVLIIAVSGYVYLKRSEIQTMIFGLKEVVLADAYERRLPTNVSIPANLTGGYIGELKYTTTAGDIAFVDVTLFIDGKKVHDVVVDISSTTKDIGPYRLNVEYAPGYLKYVKMENETIVYEVENTFPSTSDSIAQIDGRGRFLIELSAVGAGIDPKIVPDSEKDRLGNVIFLKMEGAFAGNDRFIGGILTSASPLMGWEVKKK